MPTTVYVDMPDLSGEAGPFYLFLRSKAGALLNSGGDQLAEVQVSAENTGRWSATVAEAWTADLVARIYEGSSEAAAAIVWTGWLPNGETELRAEYPAATGGGLTSNQQSQLDRIEAAASQINGARLETSGAVTPGGSIQLIVGKDYVTAAQNGLNRTVSDPGGILAAQLQSSTQAAVKRFGAQRPSGGPQIVGTIGSVTYANGVTTIPIEISRDAIPDTLKPGDDYRYMIERQTSDGKLVVCVSGDLSLERRTV